MLADESKYLCLGIITSGFKASNDFGGRLKFEQDDITIIFIDHIWRIDDLVNGPSDYISLKELMIKERWRWQDDDL